MIAPAAPAASAAAAALAAFGLMACGGAPPAPAAPPATPEPPDKIVQLNAPGEPVDIVAALPAGYVTVVDFWSQSCAPCATFGAMLEAGIADEPRVVIRKIDVGDGDTPVAAAYQIAVLPHFFLYDKHKRLRYDLVGPDCARAASYARQLAAE